MERAHSIVDGWRFVLLRALILSAGWWIISEGDGPLAFGAPVVLLGLVTSLLLRPPGVARWSLQGLLRYALAFILGSLRGGFDVALRAVAPHMPLSPTLVQHELRLPPGAARYLFMGTLSLMPGTLSVRVGGQDPGPPILEVHFLVDRGEASVRQLRVLEEHVARALGAF